MSVSVCWVGGGGHCCLDRGLEKKINFDYDIMTHLSVVFMTLTGVLPR